MNIFKEYIAYIKNNPEGYWFKRKMYGWGWTPATWQGWTVILLFLIALIALVWDIDESASFEMVVKEIGLPFVALIILLVVISWRTGEPPKWTWYKPKDSNKHEKDHRK